MNKLLLPFAILFCMQWSYSQEQNAENTELDTNYKEDQLESLLETGLTEGRPASKLATDLKRYLQEPNRRFRRIRDKETGKLILSIFERILDKHIFDDESSEALLIELENQEDHRTH